MQSMWALFGVLCTVHGPWTGLHWLLEEHNHGTSDATLVTATLPSWA